MAAGKPKPGEAPRLTESDVRDKIIDRMRLKSLAKAIDAGHPCFILNEGEQGVFIVTVRRTARGVVIPPPEPGR